MAGCLRASALSIAPIALWTELRGISVRSAIMQMVRPPRVRSSTIRRRRAVRPARSGGCPGSSGPWGGHRLLRCRIIWLWPPFSRLRGPLPGVWPYPRGMPSGWVCAASRRHRGSLGRRQAKRQRDRSRWPSPPFERFHCSRWIKSGISADEHDHTFLKLGLAELGYDLVYGALMQQQSGGDDGFMFSATAQRSRSGCSSRPKRFMAQEHIPAAGRRHRLAASHPGQGRLTGWAPTRSPAGRHRPVDAAHKPLAVRPPGGHRVEVGGQLRLSTGAARRRNGRYAVSWSPT